VRERAIEVDGVGQETLLTVIGWIPDDAGAMLIGP
jgi:hypothetical protein